MPLIKTVELPGGMGQHFFFDCGGGNALAFFWFPDAPAKVPGLTHPGAMPGLGDISSAVASCSIVSVIASIAYAPPNGSNVLATPLSCAPQRCSAL